MSFFSKEQLNTTGTAEIGGMLEPIPEKTNVKAMIADAEWYTPKEGGDRTISITWEVLLPKEYNGRKVFQKLKVEDADKAKREKAMAMLAAIDKNAGGKLAATNKVPDDDSLSLALTSKAMVLLLGVWDIEGKKGNWVMAVSPAKPSAAAAAPIAPPPPAPAATNFDDDIPF